MQRRRFPFELPSQRHRRDFRAGRGETIAETKMKLRIILSVAWITLLAVVAGAARAGKAPAPAATGLVAACESARHDGRADGPRGAAARSDAVVHGPALALPPL